MIQIGYFTEFKGAPAVVLAAGAADFDRLAQVLLSADRSEVDVIAALRDAGHQLHLVNVSGLKITPHSIRTKLSVNGPVVHWELSDSYAARFAGLISGLKEHASSGHQYLESGSPRLQLILSKDEYSKPLA